MATALTVVRLLLVFPFAVLMARGDESSATLAGLTLVTAIATDLLDEAVARHRGTESAVGRFSDHTVDFLFVTSGLLAGATRGVFPWILPLVITAAFVQYVIDSYWLHGQGELRMSRLGRYNGIFYFIPLGADVLIRMGLEPLQPLLTPLVWILVLSTLLSMGERLIMVTPKAPDWPVAETEDQSRH